MIEGISRATAHDDRGRHLSAKPLNASADRLIELFNEAQAISAGADRERFLDASCGHDAPLRERVAALVAAYESAGDFLTPTPQSAHFTVVTEKPGDRIGRYKLLEQIGEGG